MPIDRFVLQRVARLMWMSRCDVLWQPSAKAP
jgi:hypothetical protein